jgi:hypothetical protein
MSLCSHHRRAGALLGLGLLAGCAGSPGLSLLPFTTNPDPAPAPAAKSCQTPEACAAELRKLVKDPKRDWVGRPQSPEVYANGTRFFAYRALRKKLSCAELARALEETQQATQTLEPGGLERVRALSVQVARELKSEQTRRCRSQG